MLGAIIGDVAGSIYEVAEILAKKNKSKVSYEERIKILDRGVNLFLPLSSATDDSILTVAIADALLNGKDYGFKLMEYGKMKLDKGLDIYGRSRFGPGFVKWVLKREFTESFSNGCAMRISSIPTLLNDRDQVLKEVYKATVPTHNHPESLLCAKAVADTILMAKKKLPKSEMKKYVEENYFLLDYDLENLRKNYEFTSKVINSIPQAIYVFLESNDFEDSIRNAISIGGDTDTIACITGSISESYYGVPESLKEQVLKYVPDYMIDVINQFYDRKKRDGYARTISAKINRK